MRVPVDGVFPAEYVWDLFLLLRDSMIFARRLSRFFCICPLTVSVIEECDGAVIEFYLAPTVSAIPHTRYI
jgi:hypothetical protein